jgi:hypothetical protein
MNGKYRIGVEALSSQNGINATTMGIIQSSIQNAHILAQSLGGEVQKVIVQTSSQAFVNGVRESFFVGSIGMALAAAIAWVVLPTREKEIEVRKERVSE